MFTVNLEFQQPAAPDGEWEGMLDSGSKSAQIDQPDGSAGESGRHRVLEADTAASSLVGAIEQTGSEEAEKGKTAFLWVPPRLTRASG